MMVRKDDSQMRTSEINEAILLSVVIGLAAS